MDYLYANFNKIPSYNKINEVFQKIEQLNVLKYNYKNDSLVVENFNQSVLNHISQLEEKIFSCYKDEAKEIIKLLPVINSKKTKEIEPVFYQISEESKKEIFSYIYWKYKHECSNEKVNMQNLKKIMGLKGSKEEHIIPVEVEIKCHKCNEKAFIYFYNYELEYTSYKCLNCGHKEKSGWHKNFYTLLNCHCNSCMDIKRELQYTIKDNLKILINDVNSQLLNQYFEIKDILPPAESIMEKDFKLYMTSLTKDEREVLSFKPKCKDELFKIIDDIQTRDSIYSKKHNNVIKKLRDHKVIYYTRNKITNDKIKNKLFEMIFKSIVEIREGNCKIIDANKKRKYLDKLYNYLDKTSLDDFSTIYRGDLCFEIDNIHIEYDRYLNIELQDIDFFEEDIVINYNYIKNEIIPISNKVLIEKKIIRKVLASEPERNVYLVLRNKYTQCIILPNYNFSKIFNVDFLYNILSEDECKYLKTCILDIVLCDIEGIPFKVIEVQKGSHHNNSEWIRKDGIKKKACTVLGIEFEEIY